MQSEKKRAMQEEEQKRRAAAGNKRWPSNLAHAPGPAQNSTARAVHAVPELVKEGEGGQSTQVAEEGGAAK